MYDIEHWTIGNGAVELEDFREKLRRHGWLMKISLEEGGGVETWFPGADQLGATGISLTAKHHGFWSTLRRDNSEIVDAFPEELDRYLASLEPHVA
jgi:hypothetical protein